MGRLQVAQLPSDTLVIACGNNIATGLAASLFATSLHISCVIKYILFSLQLIIAYIGILSSG
jgi:hypothetical protein